MKIANIFVPIFLIYSSSLESNSDKNLSSSICKIINNITELGSNTQDVLIGNLNWQIWSLTVNDIIQCIGDDTAVIIGDFETAITEEKLKLAAIVVLLIHRTDENSIFKIINDHQKSTVFHHMAKIICIVPSWTSIEDRANILDIFCQLGFLNVAVAYELSSKDTIYNIIMPMPNYVQQIINPDHSDLIFPDKLKDLNGFVYQVPIYYQPPYVALAEDNSILSPMIFFLAAVGTIQNARIEFALVNHEQFKDLWLEREMHMSINTGITFKFAEPKLLNYDKKSYCALIPIPPKKSFLHLIFIKPFDWIIWMLFGVSMTSSVAVWRMFRGRGAVDTHWQLATGIFTMFIGQGADFSRHNRFVLAVLLNIICMSVFLLSNLYEGVITSFMIEPTHENRLKTVEDLVASDYKILPNRAFQYIHQNSSLLDALELKTVPLIGKPSGPGLVIEQQYVMIQTCLEASQTLTGKLENGRSPTDYYYLLPEQLSWIYVQLEASFMNPFLERFQYYMDLCFQAGLPHMWKVMVYQDFSGTVSIQSRDEQIYLELKDLGVIFLILAIGCSLSGAVLMAEIFYHDCIKNVRPKKILSGCWAFIKRKICSKRKTQKLKVSKIFVKPKNR